jgi:hypothetical protein
MNPLLAAITLGLIQSAVAAKPNILLILADDQRFDTIHALGNPDLITPNKTSTMIPSASRSSSPAPASRKVTRPPSPISTTCFPPCANWSVPRGPTWWTVAASLLSSPAKDRAELYQQSPRQAALAWFDQARLGMFIHWGVWGKHHAAWAMFNQSAPQLRSQAGRLDPGGCRREFPRARQTDRRRRLSAAQYHHLSQAPPEGRRSGCHRAGQNRPLTGQGQTSGIARGLASPVAGVVTVTAVATTGSTSTLFTRIIATQTP